MTNREEIINSIKAYFESNEDAFNYCIEELDSYNGYLGDDRYYDMEELADNRAEISGIEQDVELCELFDKLEELESEAC